MNLKCGISVTIGGYTTLCCRLSDSPRDHAGSGYDAALIRLRKEVIKTVH